MVGNVTAVVGAQWGDEGKGAVIAELAQHAHLCVRANGGNNAGHTLYDSEGKKVVVNIAPSGILYPHVTNIIANGCVVDLEVLDKNMQGARGKLLLSDAAHLIFDYHQLLDGAQEKSKGSGKIGTTKKGIGPAYADKINRMGIRAGLLQHPERLEELLRKNIFEKNTELLFYKSKVPDLEIPIIDADMLIAKMKPLFEKYAPLVTDTRLFLQQAFYNGKKIILEGAQGAMLDLDHGTYPFVTSSNTNVTGLLAGSGLPTKWIGSIFGVVKAYTSRVGEGIFPTEGEPGQDINRYEKKDEYLRDCALTGNEQQIVRAGDIYHPEYDKLVSRYLRETADEFGSTTGRPRRVGWLDAVALRKAAEMNGFDSLILTRLDNLDGIGKLKICVGYERYENGEVTERLAHFSNDQERLQGFRPKYEVLKGWENTKGIKSFKNLPSEAKDYVATLEFHVHSIPVSRIKNGCKQEDYIDRT